MCLMSWESTKKNDPRKLFQGDFLGQKGSPKRAIFGHKKFSLLFFLLLTTLTTHTPLKIIEGVAFHPLNSGGGGQKTL